MNLGRHKRHYLMKLFTYWSEIPKIRSFNLSSWLDSVSVFRSGEEVTLEACDR